jgi:hypothetical protein
MTERVCEALPDPALEMHGNLELHSPKIQFSCFKILNYFGVQSKFFKPIRTLEYGNY